MAGHAAALMHEPQQRDQADRLMAQVLKVTADTGAKRGQDLALYQIFGRRYQDKDGRPISRSGNEFDYYFFCSSDH